MAGSLRDQLLKAGLADEKKAKQLAKEKRDEALQKKSAGKHANNAAIEARRQQQINEQAARAERDREINRKKQENLARKALYAEVRQLIDSNRVERKGGEVGYRFRDGTKIEKIYVTDVLQQQLARGQLGIARLAKQYVLVPAETIARLQERDPENRTNTFVALAVAGAEQAAADDPYAQFQVPDDLMW